jgi:hypothetical protein
MHQLNIIIGLQMTTSSPRHVQTHTCYQGIQVLSIQTIVIENPTQGIQRLLFGYREETYTIEIMK